MLIVTATDRLFSEMAGVMLKSLELNGCIPEADILVLSDGLKRSDRARLQGCIARPLTFVDKGRIRLPGVRPSRRSPLSTYLRLGIPQFSGAHTRVLYLDADIIVNKSLRELVSMDMEGFAVAAVAADDGDVYSEPLGLPPNTPYLNAGVMLIDMQKWRSESCSERALGFLQRKPFIRYADQDAINAILAGRFKPLEKRWNYYRAPPEGITGASIIHFVVRKPMWASNHDLPGADIYRHIRSQTPWAGIPAKSRFHRWRVERFRSIRGRLRKAAYLLTARSAT